MPTDEIKALEDDSLDLRLKKSRGPGFIPMVSLLLAFGAMSLAAWMWWEGRTTAADEASALQSRLQGFQQTQSSQASDIAALEQQLENMAGASPDAAVRSLRASQTGQAQELATLEQSLDAQRARSERLQRELAAMESRLLSLEGELAAASPSGGMAPEQLDIAAVEYLLRLAPERLILFADIHSAERALEAADAHLAAMDNPVYFGLRRQIADALQMLDEVSLPNAVDLSAQLDGLQHQVAALEFAGQGSIAVAEQASESGEEPGWWDRLVASLSGLVTVRRDEADAASRLTLQEKDLLHQGVWMQLESARLALMRHDQQAWTDALQRADASLKQWFEPGGAAFQAIQQGVADLLSVEVAPELPDVAGPWARLQQIQAARSGVAPAPQPAQDPGLEPTPAATAEPAEAEPSEAESGDDMSAEDNTETSR